MLSVHTGESSMKRSVKHDSQFVIVPRVVNLVIAGTIHNPWKDVPLEGNFNFYMQERSICRVRFLPYLTVLYSVHFLSSIDIAFIPRMSSCGEHIVFRLRTG